MGSKDYSGRAWRKEYLTKSKRAKEKNRVLVQDLTAPLFSLCLFGKINLLLTEAEST